MSGPKHRMLSVTAEVVRPLRARILRAGLPVEAAVFPGDDAPLTIHAAAYVGDEIVGVATAFPEPAPYDARSNDWRLRGMATAETHRGMGLGQALFVACVGHATAHGGHRLWFNARTGAEGFYTGQGCVTVSEVFQIEGAGPHVAMEKALTRL